MEDVDAGDGVEGNGDVEVEMAGFGVVDAETVKENEGLLEGGAAEGEIGLDAGGGARLQVEGCVLTEEIDDGVGDKWLVAGIDEVDGAVALGQWEGFERGGDGDALGDGGWFGLGLVGIRGGELCQGGVEAKKAEKAQDFPWNAHLAMIACDVEIAELVLSYCK